MHHVARVLASPLTGVYSTHIDSAQQFSRHWHDTYGFGFLEHGAQEWFSGRGIVRGYPGEVITTNPGEVHDGRPLGPPTRRWRIVYVDVDVMTTLTASERGRAEITSTSDRKSTRLNSSHDQISYAVFCLKKKKCPHVHV